MYFQIYMRGSRDCRSFALADLCVGVGGGGSKFLFIGRGV